MTFAIPQGGIPMQTLNRAAGIAIMLFFGGLGLMIGSRIDQVTIAVLGGVLLGLLVVIPPVMLLLVLIQRDRTATSRQNQEMPPAYYPQQPSTIAPPPAKATVPAPPIGYDEPFTIAKGRRVHIIGGSSTNTSQLLDDPDTF
jgi:hypothetical protein